MAFVTNDQIRILQRYFHQESHFPEMKRYLEETLESFITKEIAPLAAAHDETETFHVENFHKIGALGFFSIPFPEEYGGMGMNPVYHLAALESLAKGDAGFALGTAIHGTMCDGLVRFAGDSMKRRVLPDLISGKAIGCFGLSESDSGSDAQAMRTSYRKDKAGNYILNGQKFWITNAPSADYFFVMARDAEKPEIISSLLVEKPKDSTFKINPIKDKMGVRGSNTGELVFENHVVPAANLIGKEGDGFRYAMHMLNGGRTTIGAWSTGIAQGSLEKFLTYAHERKLFGGLLKDLDTVKREVAEMLIEIRGARELTYASAYSKSTNDPEFPCDAACAKVAGTEAAFRVAERAIELSGGFGYLKESKLERNLRDAVLGRIGEGANELLLAVVIPRFIYKAFEKHRPMASW